MTKIPPSHSQRQHPESNTTAGRSAGPEEGALPSNKAEEESVPTEIGQDHESKAPYSVGRGRPPKHSRFIPGQSGNPKGRKKKSRNLRTIVKQVLDEDIKIQVGGRVRRMPAIEALVRTTLAHALKREPKAVASLTMLMRQAGYGVDHDDGGADLLATPEINAVVENFVARLGRKDPGVPSGNKEGSP